ncbi:MAG: LysR family transcriptional regulator [Hyphomicrobiaceae bacterium]
MDINLARTFLMVSETGSFIETARRMNLTQSTVSARIKSLETMLGRALFDRSKLGATLTTAGEQFRRHALAMVRVWQHAQMEIGLTEQHRDLLSAAAPLSLWEGLLLRWVAWMRKEIPDIAVSAAAAQTQVLTQRLVEGTLDLAVMYRPVPPPGLEIEHLFDEEFVLVTGPRQSGRRASADYMSIDWCPEFQIDYAAAFPNLTTPGLHLDLGPAALDYLIGHDASGYAPYRLVHQHIERGRLKLARRSRKFTYPVYAVYPEARDEEAFEPILQGLRNVAQRIARTK